MATVLIPTPLRRFTNNIAKVSVDAGNVSDVVNALAQQFPELKTHLFDAEGKIPSFINIFVGEDDIRGLQQERTQVMEHTVVNIVPAIAGGAE